MSHLYSDLVGQVALITGASSGIGKETAIVLSTHGVNLCLTGRNECNLSSVAEDCQSKGVEVLQVLCDITDEEGVKALLEKTIATFGKLNILVNNAGMFKKGSIEQTSLAQFDEVFNTNVRSVYHLTMLAVPHLTKTKGVIINVSSVLGSKSSPGTLAHCMSKSAINMFTRCVALDLAPKQIRVNSVNPGTIKTGIFKTLGLTDDEIEKYYERAKQNHALGRAGTADEVANVIVFLASNASSFITGAQIPICGGRHAMSPR